MFNIDRVEDEDLVALYDPANVKIGYVFHERLVIKAARHQTGRARMF